MHSHALLQDKTVFKSTTHISIIIHNTYISEKKYYDSKCYHTKEQIHACDGNQPAKNSVHECADVQFLGFCCKEADIMTERHCEVNNMIKWKGNGKGYDTNIADQLVHRRWSHL